MAALVPILVAAVFGNLASAQEPSALPSCRPGFSSSDPTSPMCYRTLQYGTGGVNWETAKMACFNLLEPYASSLAVIRDAAQADLVLRGWCGGTAMQGKSLPSGFWVGYRQLKAIPGVVSSQMRSVQSSDDSYIQAAADAKRAPFFQGYNFDAAGASLVVNGAINSGANSRLGGCEEWHEPDHANSDAECVTGNYCDDCGMIYGFLGNTDCHWSAPVMLACCEAQRVPLPFPFVLPSFGSSRSGTGSWTASVSRTGSWTPSRTVTSSITASQTATLTRSASVTLTSTATSTATLSMTATSTATSTMTATRSLSSSSSLTRSPSSSASPSASASPSLSPSVSATSSASSSTTLSGSVSPSSSESVSASSSVSASASTSPTASSSISERPLMPISLGAFGMLLGADGGAGAISATGGLQPMALGLIFFGALIAAIATCCCCWYLCCLRPAARRREAAERAMAEARLKAANLYAGVGERRSSAGMHAALGLAGMGAASAGGAAGGAAGGRASGFGANGSAGGRANGGVGGLASRLAAGGMYSGVGLYGANPALLTARGGKAASGPVVRAPRLSLALAGMQRPPERPSLSLLAADEASPSIDDAPLVIDVPEPEAAPEPEAEPPASESEPEIPAPEPEPEAEPPAPESETEDEDYVDDKEEMRAAAARAAQAAAAKKAAELALKAKKLAEGHASTSVDPKKLIIKEGVIHGEVVAAKTFTLRRVEKVRGDKDLTAMRSAAASRSARASLTPALPGGFAPRLSSSRILVGGASEEPPAAATPYSFTTVARVAVTMASGAARAKEAAAVPAAQ